MRRLFTFALLATLATSSACAHSPAEPAESAASEPTASETAGDPAPKDEPGAPPAADAPAGPARAQLTAAQCEASGGQVVGDIGDGAIFRADYVCSGGAAPLGNITPTPGEPIAIEGSVCCPR